MGFFHLIGRFWTKMFTYDEDDTRTEFFVGFIANLIIVILLYLIMMVAGEGFLVKLTLKMPFTVVWSLESQ